MEVLILILVTIIFVLIRWGTNERHQRLELQEDVVMLVDELRTARSDERSTQNGNIGCTIFFVISLALFFLYIVAMSYN